MAAATGQSLGFGPMWPNRNPYIVTLVRADGLRLPIHYSLVELVSMLMDLTELSGYDIDPTQTWGYAFRAIRGTKKPSNHSGGTAIDINSAQNPQKRPLTTNLPDAVVALWKNHGFGWGGDYGGTTLPDPMHFEFARPIGEVAGITARLRDFLANHGGNTPSPPAPLEDYEMILLCTADDALDPVQVWAVGSGGKWRVTGSEVLEAYVNLDIEFGGRLLAKPIAADSRDGRYEYPAGNFPVRIVHASFLNSVPTVPAAWFKTV